MSFGNFSQSPFNSTTAPKMDVTQSAQMADKERRIAEAKSEHTTRRGDIYLGYKRERQPILVANVNKSDAEFEKAIAPLEAEFHKALNEADEELRAKIRAIEEEA